MKEVFKTKWFLIAVGIFASLILAGLILVAVFAPEFMGEAQRSIFDEQLSHIKRLGFALRVCADGHDGKFPARISDLSSDSLREDDWQYYDPVTKQPSEWIYHTGLATGDPPETILATSPVFYTAAYGQRRFVLFVDGSAVIEKESAFQRNSTRR